MTLAEVLEELADDDEGVAVAADGSAVSYSVEEVVFALADGADAAEFRLNPAVAAAAQRTPDTTSSARGPEWVRFIPAELDDHAIDRAVAWFGSAARRARGD
jgi:2,4-dienoyl-CoA reductase-like NADH-dependent reductase (Old Yellow Enzyme family)